MKHWLLYFNLFFFIVLILIFLAPLLAGKFPKLSATIYIIFSPTCHQLARRSFFVAGHKLAVCSRCLGIYTGALITGLFYALFRRSVNGISAAAFILFLLPAAIDGSLQAFTVYESMNIIRFITGGLVGIGFAMFVYPALDRYSYPVGSWE